MEKLWNPEEERKLIKNLIEDDVNVWAEIQCESCGHKYEAFFKKSSKCPQCNAKVSSTTPQGRNNPLAARTEEFAANIIDKALKEAGLGEFAVDRNVRCDDLGLTSRTKADAAIVRSESHSNDNYAPEQIKVIFEVKMSVIWNWELDKEGKLVVTSDYDGHKGRGSIYRTDSILKAIGKATIFRGYPKSNTVPFIVIGNSPPPKGYLDNIDASVASGIVQKYLSLTPNPLVVDPSDSEERNPKESDGKGFLRMDSLDELKRFVKNLVKEDIIFFSSMLGKPDLGKLIKSLDLSKEHKEIGQEFFDKLYKAGGV